VIKGVLMVDVEYPLLSDGVRSIFFVMEDSDGGDSKGEHSKDGNT